MKELGEGGVVLVMEEVKILEFTSPSLSVRRRPVKRRLPDRLVFEKLHCKPTNG
jgi:hypothetical protein